MLQCQINCQGGGGPPDPIPIGLVKQAAIGNAEQFIADCDVALDQKDGQPILRLCKEFNGHDRSLHRVQQATTELLK